MSRTKLEAALAAVGRACRATRAVQRDLAGAGTLTKEDRSPVTLADYCAQALVTLDLAGRLGARPIMGEESSRLLREAGNERLRRELVERIGEFHPEAAEEAILAALDAGAAGGERYTGWVLDPVDGTKGFLRGAQYAIALAWLEGGRPQVGVLGAPNLSPDPRRGPEEIGPGGTLFYAEKGGGAWQIALDEENPCRTPISATRWRRKDPVRSCESVESAHSDRGRSAELLARLPGAAAPVRLDSQCKYGVVARGQADAYLRLPTRDDYVEKAWDHAAGSLIAAEAGAVVTDMAGRELDFTRGRKLAGNRGVICAAPGLHEEILRLL